MLPANTIKIRNRQRTFVVERPSTFDDLKSLFESRFNLPKSELNIYYLDPLDGKQTHVEDDSDFELAFSECPYIKFFSDAAPTAGAKGREMLTMDLLKTSYFKNWYKNSGLSTDTLSKYYNCYSCKLANLRSFGCGECGGTGKVNYETFLPKLNALIADCIDDLVLERFKKLHNRIMNQHSSIDQSMYLDKTLLNTNGGSFELSKSLNMHGTIKIDSPGRNDTGSTGVGILRALTSPVEEFKPRVAQVSPVRDYSAEDRLVDTEMFHRLTAKPAETSAKPETIPDISLAGPIELQNVRERSIGELLNAPASGAALPSDRQANTPFRREELVYDTVKTIKVFHKEGYITINVMIYSSNNTAAWPEGVYIVGDSNSPITRDVMIKIDNTVPKKGFLPQVIKFKVNEALIKEQQSYPLLFEFKSEDEEKKVSYWSKPFCATLNMQGETVKKTGLVCDYVSF